MMLNRLEYLRDKHMFGYRVSLDCIIGSTFDTLLSLNPFPSGCAHEATLRQARQRETLRLSIIHDNPEQILSCSTHDDQQDYRSFYFGISMQIASSAEKESVLQMTDLESEETKQERRQM